jgi:hypothetical protein
MQKNAVGASRNQSLRSRDAEEESKRTVEVASTSGRNVATDRDLTEMVNKVMNIPKLLTRKEVITAVMVEEVIVW